MPEVTISPIDRGKAAGLVNRIVENKSGPLRSRFWFSEDCRLFARDGVRDAAQFRLRVGSAQILMRIHRHVVYAHLVMEVGASSPARLSDIANHLAARYVLSRHYSNFGKVTIYRPQVMAMVEDDLFAIA
jgi:hypothetical protein